MAKRQKSKPPKAPAYYYLPSATRDDIFDVYFAPTGEFLVSVGVDNDPITSKANVEEFVAMMNGIANS